MLSFAYLFAFAVCTPVITMAITATPAATTATQASALTLTSPHPCNVSDQCPTRAVTIVDERNTPHYRDDTVTLWHGDALDVLRSMPSGTVDCCVTSPPYFGLRDYGVAGQIGAEGSPAEFVARLVEVFAEFRRVLADDGTCWVNLGDSYSVRADAAAGRTRGNSRPNVMPGRINTTATAPRKNLLGIPWRAAFALQDDGWFLRNDVVWAKPNAMPESVTDRLSTRHEHLFLLTKSPRYWFDLDPIREPHREVSIRRTAPHRTAPGRSAREGLPYLDGNGQTLRLDQMNHAGGRNPGDVWTIPTVPYPGAHFAVMPPEIPRRAILAGCRPGGTVLDPFSGSGTTGMVAQQLGRRYVGIDLNSEYLDLSLRTRLGAAALPINEETSC